MAVIAGARTFHQVRATVKAGFMPVMKVSWIVSPISLAFAQQFLPEHTWVPFFNIIGFIIGTYVNAHTKKKRLAALRRKHYGDGSGRDLGGSSGRDLGGSSGRDLGGRDYGRDMGGPGRSVAGDRPGEYPLPPGPPGPRRDY
jgi:hypothetical protein